MLKGTKLQTCLTWPPPPLPCQYLPVAFVSPLTALCLGFLAEGFGDELTLDWLRDDSDPDEFFLTLASLSLLLSFPLSRCLNIFRQDLERLKSPPLPS